MPAEDPSARELEEVPPIERPRKRRREGDRCIVCGNEAVANRRCSQHQGVDLPHVRSELEDGTLRVEFGDPSETEEEDTVVEEGHESPSAAEPGATQVDLTTESEVELAACISPVSRPAAEGFMEALGVEESVLDVALLMTSGEEIPPGISQETREAAVRLLPASSEEVISVMTEAPPPRAEWQGGSQHRP